MLNISLCSIAICFTVVSKYLNILQQRWDANWNNKKREHTHTHTQTRASLADLRSAFLFYTIACTHLFIESLPALTFFADCCFSTFAILFVCLHSNERFFSSAAYIEVWEVENLCADLIHRQMNRQFELNKAMKMWPSCVSFWFRCCWCLCDWWRCRNAAMPMPA